MQLNKLNLKYKIIKKLNYKTKYLKSCYFKNQMKLLKLMDCKKCFDLLVGIVGINFTFIICGLLFQWITKIPYRNSTTQKDDFFRSATGLIAIQRGIVWIMAEVYNKFAISPEKKTKVPNKNWMICGFIIFFSSITMTEAIYLVSFPLTIMVKSCNILSVILVGVMCSRVTDKQLKLGKTKIVVAIIASIGILMFRFFDPEVDLTGDGKKTQIFGMLLLLASLVADGFLPDFQAQIKQKFKPAPTQMMMQVNKWSFIFCFLYAIVIEEFVYTVNFFMYHPLFIVHLMIMSVMAFLGQIFVYRMIKQFKQHIVPFVTTTRKIITVAFSLIYFKHKSSIGQIIGIILVFIVTAYEFLYEMLKPNSQIQNIPISEKSQFLQNASSFQIQKQLGEMIHIEDNQNQRFK